MRRQLIRKAKNTSLVLMICATLCVEAVAQDKTDYANGDVSKGFSAQAYPMSQNGWARNGFTAEERDKLIAAGLPNGNEAIKWSSVLSKAGQKAPDVIGAYYKAGKHFGFDAADLGAIFDAIGQHPPTQRMEAEEIFREAAAVHGGANAEQVYDEYLTRAKKRKDEAQALDAIGRYGADLVRKCGGNPVAMAPLMAFDDPYAPKGKCYTALISDQWGDKQWIDENTILLMTVIPGTTQSYSTVFMDPSSHLRFGHRALVIGASPLSYTAVSGAQTVAPTFIVLKYLD